MGRQREMGELRAAMEDALSGQGRLVMLVGEPGIGKTRTAQELATYAGLRGAQTLWGRCYEEQGMPPYWPWVQAIRSYVRDRDPQQLRSEMGSGASDIATVISDVKDRLPDLQPPPVVDSPEQARFRQFDSITSFLKSASQKQPLVLVLDDLHWADHPSLLLLQFMAKELGDGRLLVMGTYRDVEVSRRHPLSQTLGELTRESLFRRVLLRGWNQEDVGRFIEVVSGFAPPPGLVESVHRQTEGNPLFATEVVRLLVQEEELTAGRTRERDSWRVRIPEGVREVIGRRLDRLTDPCNQTLTLAAVVGREFSLEQLKPLLDDPQASSGLAMTEVQLLEVLEEALQARIVEELPRAAGQYQFTHTLIQETLAEELSLTRRVQIHARIAEALEDLYGSQADAHAGELAYHFAQAEMATGTEKLVRYAMLAGQRALDSYAFEVALGYFQRALAAKRGQPMDSELAELLFGLGHAQIAMDQAEDAVVNLITAFDYYADSGDISRAVAIAQNPHSVELIGGMREVVARAVQLAPPGSLESGRILSNHGYCLGLTPDGYEAARQAIDQALAVAQHHNDEALEMRVLAHGGNIDGFHLRWEGSLAQSLQALDLANRIDDPHTKIRSHLWALNSLASAMGNLEGAKYHVAEMRATAERLRDRRWLARALGWQTALSRLTGDWLAGRDLCDHGLSLFPNNQDLLGHRALIEYQVGNFDQGQAYLNSLLEQLESAQLGQIQNVFLTTFIAQVALITGVANRLDLVEAHARALLSAPINPPWSVSLARCGLALIAVILGNVPLADEQYTGLAGQQHTFIARAGLPVGRVLGLLAQTMGNPDQAATHFEDALTFCRKAGYRPELAWTCCDYADALFQRNGPGDFGKAIPLLDEVASVSTELGMRPLNERVGALQAKMGSPRARTPLYPNGLTRREVEVLRLVAGGKSNPEVGEELLISLNTVKRHIANIFAKTGTANRAEAAAYAARQDLL
ncbi:MAG: AAA family ATPase [Dehalococcoidia bacterium]